MLQTCRANFLFCNKQNTRSLFGSDSRRVHAIIKDRDLGYRSHRLLHVYHLLTPVTARSKCPDGSFDDDIEACRLIAREEEDLVSSEPFFDRANREEIEDRIVEVTEECGLFEKFFFIGGHPKILSGFARRANWSGFTPWGEIVVEGSESLYRSIAKVFRIPPQVS